MALSAGVPGENILLFTWHHVHHIGVPNQWDGSYVAVPKQSCCVVELFSYVSLRNKHFWSSECTKVCLIAKTATITTTTNRRRGRGGNKRELLSSPLALHSSFLLSSQLSKQACFACCFHYVNTQTFQNNSSFIP